MYKKELVNLLNKNDLPKSLMLYGVCSYQINHFGDIILNTWQSDKDNTLTFYFDAYDFSSAKQHLSQSSLFCDKNVAVIKTDKSLPKKELDSLVDICKKNDNSYLLLQYFTDDKKVKTMANSFSKKKSADFVRFFKLNTGEAVQMLNLEARALSLNIQPYALGHLLALHHEDVSLAKNELDKLSIKDGEITKQDIDELVFGLGEVNLEDFIVKIIEKQDIKNDFAALIESGQYEETYIINAIENYISTLFLFHAYIKVHGNFDPKAILGYPLPMHIAQKRANQSMRLKLETFNNILQTLINAEYAFKKSNVTDKSTYLLSVILKIQSFL